jgi:hypothetical protein
MFLEEIGQKNLAIRAQGQLLLVKLFQIGGKTLKTPFFKQNPIRRQAFEVGDLEFSNINTLSHHRAQYVFYIWTGKVHSSIHRNKSSYYFRLNIL